MTKIKEFFGRLKSLFHKREKIKAGMVQNHSVGSRIADVIIYIILIALALVFLVPMWHVLMSSVSDGRTMFGSNGITLWPKGFTFEGYAILFGQMGTFAEGNLIRGFFNTILYVFANVGIGLCINVVAGFCLSRKTKLRGVMTLFCMFSLIFSAGTIPTYIWLDTLKFTKTPLSVILPMCTNGMFMVLTMNAFLSVPEATIEAARIDGAGYLRIMFQIMLPQAMPLITVIIINTAILHWNQWFQAQLYLSSQREWWPLQLWIKEIVANNRNFLDTTNPNYNQYLVQFCVIIVATLPVLIVFPFFQKKLERNAMAGAVKG